MYRVSVFCICLLVAIAVARGQQSIDSVQVERSRNVSLTIEPRALMVEKMIDVAGEFRLNDDESLGADAGYEHYAGSNG